MTTLRARLVAAALTVTTGLVLLAPPANAEEPAGWPENPDVPLLHALGIYLFAPIGLFIVIALLVLAPSLVRGDRSVVSGQRDDEWFGGPVSGPDAPDALESGASDKSTGGASGNW